MNNKKFETNLIKNLIIESESYTNLDSIEGLVQQGMDLSHHPVQPLYLVMKQLPPEVAAKYLHKFSRQQRKVFMDLDLWEKDNLNIELFNNWLNIYSHTDEDLRFEFIESDEFLLFLKARFNIWTFDHDDPNYPDHDNYFLTDDSLLLFEFNEDFEHLKEIKEFIRLLYSKKGVEYAYAHLFKLVSESFSILLEDEFAKKKSTLSDFGFVDYFEALNMDIMFTNKEVMDNFIKNKKIITANIDYVGQGQALHRSALVAFNDGCLEFSEQLSKVDDEKRQKYLHFNFIRLVNGTISLTSALQSGPVAMTRVGNRTKNLLKLGFDYVVNFKSNDNVFEKFDFTELYRIGNTLTKTIQKKIKKVMIENGFSEDHEHFIGKSLLDYFDYSMEEIVKCSKSFGDKIEILNTSVDYHRWVKQSETFIQILPFIKQFYHVFSDLKKHHKISDDFYINYTILEIDFEAIIISNFINFRLGNFEDEKKKKKLGITINEFKKFIDLIFVSSQEISKDLVDRDIKAFANKFGLEQVHGFHEYLRGIIIGHLTGYDFKHLKISEYKHVGGPILLIEVES